MSSNASACSSLDVAAYASAGSTIGIAYLGVAISAMAYGITCSQAFNYYRSEKSSHDHSSLKVLVALLLLIAGLQEALIIHAVYWYLVVNFSNPCTLVSRVIWSIPAGTVLNIPLATGVRGFLIYRIWRLSRNILLTAICPVIVLAASVTNIIYLTELHKVPDLQDIFVKLRWLGIASFTTSMIADAFVTTILVFYLCKIRTGFRRSDSLVTKLIVITISTGLLTPLTILAELMTYILAAHTFTVIFFTFLVGKMYLNSMLTTLNLRSRLGASSSESTTHYANTFHLSRIDVSPPPANQSIHPRVTVNLDDVIDLSHSVDTGSLASEKVRAESH